MLGKPRLSLGIAYKQKQTIYFALPRRQNRIKLLKPVTWIGCFGYLATVSGMRRFGVIALRASLVSTIWLRIQFL